MIGLNDPALGKSSRLGSAERCAFRDRRLFDQQKSSVSGGLGAARWTILCPSFDA
jgi:hypothetical protein